MNQIGKVSIPLQIVAQLPSPFLPGSHAGSYWTVTCGRYAGPEVSAPSRHPQGSLVALFFNHRQARGMNTSLHQSPESERTDSEETVPVAVLDQLATSLAALARQLEHEHDTAHTLQGIVRTAIDLIPGAQEASISVVSGRRVVVPQAASSEMARKIDAVQTATGQGPCLDAIYEQATVRVPDMANETRWPAFAAKAHGLGAGSMLSFQLFVEGDNLGSLNLFSPEPHAFSEESEHVGLLFASHAAVALADRQAQDQLEFALSTRDIIGQAKGILMERHKITGDAAFRLLSQVSQEHNMKLRDVANRVVSDYGQH